MPREVRMVDVEVKIHHETEKAILITSEKIEEKTWLPKRINGDEYEIDEREKGFALITVPEWWAVEKELI